jgi:ABC-type transport system involved in multi-copper enzyme maturation permease subunit
MLPRAQSLWVLLLLLVPVAIAFRIRMTGRAETFMTGFDMYGVAVALFYVRNLLPLVALLFGSALIADAADTKTLTYYFTRPVSRLSIFLGEFSAYLATSLTVSLPCVVLLYVVLNAGTRAGLGFGAAALVQDLGACALTLFTYGAVFALMGVLFKRPLIPGLTFLFGWESLANLPGDLPNYTISAYTRSLIPYRPQEEGLAALFAKFFPLGESIITMGVVGALCLLAGAWIFSRREYVM